MNTYIITNQISGMFLGAFEANDEDGALDEMARDAGYSDFRTASLLDFDFDTRRHPSLKEIPDAGRRQD